jgi:hypothetical protein
MFVINPPCGRRSNFRAADFVRCNGAFVSAAPGASLARSEVGAVTRFAPVHIVGLVGMRLAELEQLQTLLRDAVPQAKTVGTSVECRSLISMTFRCVWRGSGVLAV